MRVGIFSESFRPLVNGVSHSVQSFARNLTEAGHEVHVFAAHYPGYEEPPGYAVYRYPGIMTTLEQGYNIAVPFWPPMIRIMKRARLQLIHTQSPFFLGTAGAHWSRWLGIPLVTTQHTLYKEYVHYAPLPPAISRIGLVTWIRHYCNRADQVIVPTDPICEVVRGYGVTRPISVVPTGIDLAAIRKADPTGIREEYGIARDAELIVFVGRLTPEKNVDLLIDAFASLATRRPKAHLLLVGGGQEEEPLTERAALSGILNRVTFAGWQPPEERNRRLRAGDLFLYPSVTETQGLVLCEALAAGLPCVAADAFGSKAVVRNKVDGFLVPPHYRSMARAVEKILSMPDRGAEMKRAALEGAERFGETRTTDGLIRVYEEALSHPPIRPRRRITHALK